MMMYEYDEHEGGRREQRGVGGEKEEKKEEPGCQVKTRTPLRMWGIITFVLAGPD